MADVKQKQAKGYKNLRSNSKRIKNKSIVSDMTGHSASKIPGEMTHE